MANLASFSYEWSPEECVVIQYVYQYHPYWNEDGERNPEFTRPLDGLFLDLKSGNDNAIKYFYNELHQLLLNNIEITQRCYFCVVPSSNPQNVPSPMQLICSRLSHVLEKEDYSQVLQRVRPIEKLSTGGNRNPERHFESIAVAPHPSIEGKSFILFDDITTTGGALAACTQILINGGAAEVICLALGRTTR